MGNGLPISSISGPSEYMRIFDKLWVSTTNGSETLSLAGTIEVIKEMKTRNTISNCWKIGKKLFEGWNKITKQNNLNVKMIGYPIRMTMKCYDSQNDESMSLKALVLQEMVKRGVFISQGPTFISYSHSSKDITYTLNMLDDVCKMINKKVSNDNYEKHLEGNPPQTIYTHSILATKKK